MKNALLSNGGWLLRVTTVTVLVAVIGLSLFPRVTSHLSTSAVVNAPILVIRSPVEGLVEEYRLENGASISRGEQIAVFREAGTDQTHRADLEARLSIASAAAVAVEHRIEEVETIRETLRQRQKVFVEWHTAILEKEVEELEALLQAGDERLGTLEAEAKRQAALRERGMTPESDQLEAKSSFEEQAQSLRAIHARLSIRRLKLAAMKDGILAGTDGTNTPYTLQRQDEVELELARLRDELRDHRAERRALEEQLKQEREIYQQENRITLSSPVAGVVWRSASLSGRPVLPGDEVVEILDCGARFLEAYLSEALMGRIGVGDLVDVRLTGEHHSFDAPIISILGHGARFDHVELAAQDNSPKTGKMRVLIALDSNQLSFDRDRFCHVGRTAQVSLPRDFSAVSEFVARFSTGLGSAIAWVGHATASLKQG